MPFAKLFNRFFRRDDSRRKHGRAGYKRTNNRPSASNNRRQQIPNRKNSFAAERDRLRRKERRDKLFTRFRRHYRVALVVVGILVTIAIIFGAGRFIVQTGYFRLDEISIAGVEQLNVEEISQFLAEYRERSLLSLSAGEVESRLQENFTYIKEAYVRKIIPNKLEVEVVERFPAFSYVNMAGAYLIDEEGVVIRVLDYEETAPLTEEELAIIEGYVNPNSEKIKARYIEQLPAEEQEKIQLQEAREERLAREAQRSAQSSSLSASSTSTDSATSTDTAEIEEEEKFVWEEVPLKKKQAVIDEMRKEYLVRVTSRLERFNGKVKELNLNLLRVVELDVYAFQQGEEFDSERFDLISTVRQELTLAGYSLHEINWRTPFNIRARIASGTEIVFTLSKPLSRQLSELAAIERVQTVNRLQEVDLRGELIAVKD